MKFRTITTLYILFIFFIPNSIALLNIPGVPLLSVSRVYILLWIVAFLVLFYQRNSIRESAETYPFYKPMSLIFLSMAMATIFSQYIGASVNLMLSFLTESFFLSLMIWVSYHNSADILNVMRKMGMIFAGLSIYGTVSFLTGVNPVMDFVNTHFASESRSLVFSYTDIERLGYFGRAASIFSHPMQYGAFLVMALCISYHQYLMGLGRWKLLNVPIIIVLLSGIPFTFSRTPILFLLVVIIIYWLLQKTASKVKFAVAALILTVSASFVVPDVVTQMIASMFGGGDIRGSSMEMRVEQLNAAIDLSSEAPFFGHGLATTRVMLESGVLPTDLHGAESEFFSLMIDTGIVGVISNVCFYLLIIFHFLKYNIMNVEEHLTQYAAIMVALIMGYVSFILSTGVLGTFQFFVIIISLIARYIYLARRENT